jgi:hypothetical protein
MGVEVGIVVAVGEAVAVGGTVAVGGPLATVAAGSANSSDWQLITRKVKQMMQNRNRIFI